MIIDEELLTTSKRSASRGSWPAFDGLIGAWGEDLSTPKGRARIKERKEQIRRERQAWKGEPRDQEKELEESDDQERKARWSRRMRMAIESGYENMLGELMQELHEAQWSADIPMDKSGETALMIAAERGHLSAMSKLMEAGASVSARSATGWTPLSLALRSKDPEAARLLLKAGLDPWNQLRNEKGEPIAPLELSAERVDEDLACEALEAIRDVELASEAMGASNPVNRRDWSMRGQDGRSALMRAVESKRVKLAAALSKRGASWEQIGPNGKAVFEMIQPGDGAMRALWEAEQLRSSLAAGSKKASASSAEMEMRSERAPRGRRL